MYKISIVLFAHEKSEKLWSVGAVCGCRFLTVVDSLYPRLVGQLAEIIHEEGGVLGTWRDQPLSVRQNRPSAKQV